MFVLNNLNNTQQTKQELYRKAMTALADECRLHNGAYDAPMDGHIDEVRSEVNALCEMVEQDIDTLTKAGHYCGHLDELLAAIEEVQFCIDD